MATTWTSPTRFGFLLLLSAALCGCQVGVGTTSPSAPPLTYTSIEQRGFASDTSTTQMVTTMVGGKNVYIPSTVVVAAGATHTLSIFNTTDAPHGFQIEGLGIEIVLLPGEETRVVLNDLKGGNLYQIGCQLHPPHRTATLVVVKAR